MSDQQLETYHNITNTKMEPHLLKGNTKKRLSSLTYAYERQTNATGQDLKTEFLRQRFAAAKSLYRRELKAHFGCVNAIEFSPNAGKIVASGN